MQADYKFAIINTDNIWKGTREAVQFCKAANVQYDLLAKQPMFEFYQTLAGYPVLVYFPIVKESFCRLVVEAKAMNCNILTSKTYGAAKEPWFNLYGKAMTKFLVNATTNNIKILKRCW